MLMADDGYAVIVVESIARSYSRISEVHPGLCERRSPTAHSAPKTEAGSRRIPLSAAS